MAITVCTLVGSLSNPGTSGVDGTLYLSYNSSSGVRSVDGSYVRVVSNLSIAIKVVNGVLTPTNIIPNGNGNTPTTLTAEFRDLYGNVLFRELWSLNSVGSGSIDVGLLAPSIGLPTVWSNPSFVPTVVALADTATQQVWQLTAFDKTFKWTSTNLPSSNVWSGFVLTDVTTASNWTVQISNGHLNWVQGGSNPQQMSFVDGLDGTTYNAQINNGLLELVG